MGGRKKIIWIFLGVVTVIAVALGIFLARNLKKDSGLQIDTFPKARVFLNDREIGATPYYQEGLEPAEYRLKLMTDEDGDFEAQVNLESGVLTMVTRIFDRDLDYSSGQVAYLAKTALSDFATLTVVSDPDEALIRIDGQDKGVTPLSVKDLKAGGHDITIAKPGFESQTVNGKLENGYELNVVLKLGKARESIGSQSATPSAQPASTPSGSAKVNKILIKETGTGFLRVRSDPSIASLEIGRVKPGDKISYLSERADWIEIKFATGSGWVSKTYVEKISQ